MLSTVAESQAFVVLGMDAYLAARPATPIQLAHACHAAGFDFAIPATWGDEIIAIETARQLATRTQPTVVLCACERVRAALAEPGPELSALLVRVAAAPVATARYLRRLHGDTPLDITFVGDCPSACDAVIDRQIAPATFLSDLVRRGIVPVNEPVAFQSMFSPDRRRFVSLPGGMPTDELLSGLGPAARAHGVPEPVVPRIGVEITSERYAVDLIQRILLLEPVLIDLGARLGCACTGADGHTPASRARGAVIALEPPRSPHPVVEPDVVSGLSVADDAESAEDAALTRNGAHGDAHGDAHAVAAYESAGEPPRE